MSLCISVNQYTYKGHKLDKLIIITVVVSISLFVIIISIASSVSRAL